MLKEYKDLRKELLSNIEKLKAFSHNRNNGRAAKLLEDIYKKVEQNTFYLVVLGEFKRGKTTFINALLGESLLPSAVVPLTSVVTMIKYGEKEDVEVFFLDGRTKKISIEEIPSYVTERENPNNEKQVNLVRISYPSPFLQDGVYLVDTPGVGSVFSNNTEVTYNFLPRADAAVFLLAADPPISQSELTFLNDVRQCIRKVFFVQNKVDRLDPQERIESLEFSKGVIKKALNLEHVEVHPLSAKLALTAKQNSDYELLEQSQLPRLEELLSKFLMSEKGKEVIRTGAEQTLRILSEEKLALEIELKALDTPLQVLEEKLKRFQEEMKRTDQDAFDAQVLFEGEIKRLTQELDMDLERFRRNEVTKMLQGLDLMHQEKKGLSLSEYAKEMENYVQNAIVKAFDNWLQNENAKLEDRYASIAARFSAKINDIIQEILEISSGLFELSIEKFKGEQVLNAESSLYYMVGDPPKFFDLEGALKFLTRSVLPKFLSQKMILGDLKKKLPELIDRNCGRVRADFAQRLQNSHFKFRWELREKVQETKGEIELAIKKTMELKKGSEKEVQETKALLEAQRASLESIASRLKRCIEAVEVGA